MNPNSKKFVCFITGASGVGKSTLASLLKSKYGGRSDVAILGFDTIGVPSIEEMIKVHGSPSGWQRLATIQWVEKILNEISEPIVILEGQMNFDFIHEAFENHDFQNFKTILIDCDEGEMLRRLKQDRAQPELANEDMKNWRAHLKRQAEQRQSPIIDTTGLNGEEAVLELEKVLGKMLN